MKCSRNLKEGDRVRILKIHKLDAHYREDNKKRWIGLTGTIISEVCEKKENGRYYISGEIALDKPPFDTEEENPYFFVVMVEKIKGGE